MCIVQVFISLYNIVMKDANQLTLTSNDKYIERELQSHRLKNCTCLKSSDDMMKFASSSISSV